jgi:hypothetical protein
MPSSPRETSNVPVETTRASGAKIFTTDWSHLSLVSTPYVGRSIAYGLGFLLTAATSSLAAMGIIRPALFPPRKSD